MAAQRRLQSSVYQWRVIMWNLLALVWLAAAGATLVLMTQASATPPPVAQRLERTQPASAVVSAEAMFSAKR